MADQDVFIVAAARTPIGAFNGALSTLAAHELGAAVIKEVLERSKVPATDVSEVILGHDLTAAGGQNPARQAAVSGGLPYTVPAWSLNMVCGSGLKSVILAAQQIQTGSGNILIAGGQESMSKAPHAVAMRAGTKMGDATMVDTAICDGLTDAFHKYHMGITAENVAKQWELSRESQDAFALSSQTKCGEAIKEDRFKGEIVPITLKTRKGDVVVAADEFPRPESTLAGFQQLKPAFIRDGSGTVTAGNSSGINDGAACVMLVSASSLKEHGLTPLVRVASWAQAGLDPAIMGTGPIPAVKKALSIAGWSVDDVDLFELNEAFAAQSLAVVQDLGVPAEKVNVNGGSIALGHPIGASGARILVTLIHALSARGLKRGVAALCIGGGMGIAICVERS